MTTAPACLICRGQDLAPLYEGVRDHYRVAREAYRFLRCRACGTATLDPQPPPDSLAALYPAHYTFKTEDADDRPARRLLRGLEWRGFYRPVYRQRLGIVQRLTGLRKGTLLEVGCGSGLFLRELAEAGYDVEGVDASSADITYARTRLGLRAHLGTLEALRLPGERYDAVLLINVLEHVPDPEATVAEVRRLLRPGGWIVLGVPVIDSWQAKVLGARWSAVTEAPRHLMIPSHEGVGRLLAASGFRDVRAAPCPLLDTAGNIALSVLPGASTPLAHGGASAVAPLVRALGALLILPATLLALAERARRGPGPRSCVMIYGGRK